jgi:hypothetical protein
MKKQTRYQRYLLWMILMLLFWAAASLTNTLSPWKNTLYAQFLYLLIPAGILLFYAFSRMAGETTSPFIEASYAGTERVGIIMYGLAIAVELAFFSSWFKIIADNPETLLRFKHIIISIPLSVGLAVALFLPINRPVSRFGTGGIFKPIVHVVLSAASFGFILFALDGFGDMKIFAVMTAVGAFIGLGHIIAGKFYLTLTTLTLIIYANSLSAGRFEGFSWIIAAEVFLFSSTILFIAWARRYGNDRMKTTCH